MLNRTDNLSLQRGFDIFLGFLYSVLVALVLKTAYLNSHFHSIMPIIYTLLLLSFFAYDWLSRFAASSKMPEEMLEKATYLYLLKIALSIFIVYFLTVFSLKIVEVYTLPTIECSFCVGHESLYYSIAIFALLSGAWNALMIYIFKGVNWPHLITLAKGHLDPDIVKMFPQLIEKWRTEIQLIVYQKQKEMTELKKNGSFDSPRDMEEYRKKWLKLERDLGFKLYFRNFLKILKKPHHLLLPYLFVFHIVILNIVLGFFIGISIYFGKISLFEKLFSAPNISLLPLLVLVLEVLVSLLLLTWHFVSSTEMRVTPQERIGSMILFITLIYGYSLCSSAVLVFLVIFQQIIADIIMTIYFEPEAPKSCNALNEASVL